MGRPRKQDNEAKRLRLEIRLSEADMELVDYIASRLKLSRSEAVLEAIESRANEIYAVERERDQTWTD